MQLSRWGRNNRLAQAWSSEHVQMSSVERVYSLFCPSKDLEFREVQMIQMMNVDASAVPKLTAFTGGHPPRAFLCDAVRFRMTCAGSVGGMAGNASWQQPCTQPPLVKLRSVPEPS